MSVIPAPVSIVTLEASAPVPPVTHRWDGVTLALLAAALMLAACSGAFSIFGLTSIFSGATMSVICMGIAFEIGKLSAVAWFGHCRHESVTLKIAVAALVFVLIALNSIGVFGFLSSAHIVSVTADVSAIERHAAEVEADVSVQADVVADLDRRIAQIDAAVHADTSRGRTRSALAIVAEQSRARGDLVVRRQAAAEKLAELKVRRAAVANERRNLEADLGPVRFLSILIGAEPEKTLRAFTLAIALLVDPSAALLLFVASRRGS